MTAPLHPQVRIVTDGGRAGYYVEVCDGRAWRCETEALFRGVAEQRARWLSDVLEHARDAALEEAAKECEQSAASLLAFGDEGVEERSHARSQAAEAMGLAAFIRAMKGVRNA